MESPEKHCKMLRRLEMAKKNLHKKDQSDSALSSGAVEIRFNFEDIDAKGTVTSILRHGEYISRLNQIYRMVKSKLDNDNNSHLKVDDIDILEAIHNLSDINC
jgi:hypothetical protein